MAEWSKATVSKIVVWATAPRVQIPLSPPLLLNHRFVQLHEGLSIKIEWMNRVLIQENKILFAYHYQLYMDAQVE